MYIIYKLFMNSKMLYYYHQFLLCYSLSVSLSHSEQRNKYCGCNSVHYSDLRIPPIAPWKQSSTL